MGSRGWHRCLPTPAEGGSEAEGAVVARRRREKGKEPPQESPSTWKASGLLAAGESCRDWRRD